MGNKGTHRNISEKKKKRDSSFSANKHALRDTKKCERVKEETRE